MGYYSRVFFIQETAEFVKNIIEKSKTQGSILPERKGWVSFTVKEYFPENVIKQYEGLLVFFEFDFEFGWRFQMYFESKLFLSYGCFYKYEFEGNKYQFANDEFVYLHYKDKETMEKVFRDSELSEYVYNMMEEYLLITKNQRPIAGIIDEARFFCGSLGVYFLRDFSYDVISELSQYRIDDHYVKVTQVDGNHEHMGLGTAISNIVEPLLFSHGFKKSEPEFMDSLLSWRYEKSIDEDEKRMPTTQKVFIEKLSYDDKIRVHFWGGYKRAGFYRIDFKPLDGVYQAMVIKDLLNNEGFENMDSLCL